MQNYEVQNAKSCYIGRYSGHNIFPCKTKFHIRDKMKSRQELNETKTSYPWCHLEINVTRKKKKENSPPSQYETDFFLQFTAPLPESILLLASLPLPHTVGPPISKAILSWLTPIILVVLTCQQWGKKWQECKGVCGQNIVQTVIFFWNITGRDTLGWNELYWEW